MTLKENIKEELKKMGMTDFNDFEDFEDEESLSRLIIKNGYFKYGDAKTNDWAIEASLKELYQAFK